MAYLGENVQLAHDVLQRAGQRLGHADGFLGLGWHGLRTPASACGNGKVHFWLEAKRKGPSVYSALEETWREE